MDREGHAHVFCAFGLSTIEFPAQQITEACAKMLALKAIREWKSRSLPESQISRSLDQIGLSWPALRKRLLIMEGAPLEKRLQDQMEITLQAAQISDADCTREMEKLR